ncbi:hypothetical protein AB0F91_37380 [Amycolatopsis sp. NPDC023774]|uniref:hypothetical protein n=1 Tax=Amycolatopsis sp. NPDC023774 TaxID=3155015 RepID=UPI0033C7F9B7
MAAAATELQKLVAWFGRDQVAVELIDHASRRTRVYNDLLADMAAELRLPTVASNSAAMVPAVRAHELEGWPPADGMALLRDGAEHDRTVARTVVAETPTRP